MSKRKMPPQACSAQVVWPEGGFRWTPTWRNALPVVRGIHVPPLANITDLTRPITLSDGNHDYRTEQIRELAKLTGRQWTYWGRRQWGVRVTEAALAQPDHEFWLQLYAHAFVMTHAVSHTAEITGRVTHQGIERHGLTFMLGVALDLGEAVVSVCRHLLPVYFGTLRHAIALAEQREYHAAHALATRERARSDIVRLICAHLFPHLEDWATDCVQRRIADGGGLVSECVMAAPVAVVYVQAFELIHLYCFRSAALLQLHLHDAAALDVLEVFLVKAASKPDLGTTLELIDAVRAPATLGLLVRHMQHKEVVRVLERATAKYPAAALCAALEHARSPASQKWAVRLALRDVNACAAALAAVSPEARERFAALLPARASAEALPQALPPLLRAPPWLSKQRAPAPPTLQLRPLPVPELIDWAATQHQRDQKLLAVRWLSSKAPTQGPERQRFVLDLLGIDARAHARILEGEPVASHDLTGHGPNRLCTLLLQLPVPAAIAVWNSYPMERWLRHSCLEMGWVLLARHELAVLPGCIAYVQQYPVEGLQLAQGIDTAQLVPLVLNALRNLKSARSLAASWIEAHVRTTLLAALPLAFGKQQPVRRDAEHVVRWLVQKGHADLVHAVAAEYGGAMQAAVTALLATDPLLILPPRMPKLPAFFVAASFTRPQLQSGELVPLGAVEHIGAMLAMKLEEPYAGLDIVRQACTAASLAAFVWDLFEAWLTAGAPTKEIWAFTALGVFGNDVTARRLAPRIREWPGASAHQRAIVGLQVLAAIGSDAALMHLSSIADHVKFKALQDDARAKIQAIATARGLTAEALADRLVPDLGLPAHGVLLLDFGPRQFQVAFDESLRPFIKDVRGVRLAALPKRQAGDVAALAKAAHERYAQLQLDAKAIAAVQVTRLELAMIARRRWTSTELRECFIEHPLLRHLAARLVWGVYQNGAWCDAFRIAEDWTLADRNDTRYELPEAANVGIAHVLDLPAELQAAFGQLFGDYEILQPFRQLGREVHVATAQELQATSIERFADKRVASSSLLGLLNRGWRRGTVVDGAWVSWCKLLGDYQVELQLDPGVLIGDVSAQPTQQLPALHLRELGDSCEGGTAPFAQLDAISLSEVLRDIDLLPRLE